MRVLLVCDFFLKYAAAQAAALARADADVLLLCRTHAQEFGGDYRERQAALEYASAAGVEIAELPGRVSSVTAMPGVLRTFSRVRAWRPQVAHVHDNQDPRLLAICARFPVVLTVHDPVLHPGHPARSRVNDVVRRLWLRQAAHYVVHAEDLRVDFARLHSVTNVTVIPHGLEPADEPFPPPAEARVLFFGRLQQYKGIPTLLAAMNHVWAIRPDVQLLVCGDGPDAELVPNDVRVVLRRGYLPEDEIDDLFRTASLVVLPYTQASQSGVGALAIARGVPVVVSDAGALPDLALDSSFVVPAGDAAALANAMLRHIGGDAQLREATLAFARSLFSWDRVAQLSLELYDELVHSRRCVA
jgi:glycosyltransferase involved in cell wall biosynthesis